MMTRTTTRAAAFVGGAALVLALAACTGGGKDPEQNEDDSSAEAAMGPLDEFFQEMYGDGSNQDEANAQMMEVEEIVASCMAEQGFEYTPVDYSSQMGGAPAELDVEWGTLEFAEQYGYGATTDPWGSSEEGSSDEPTEEWVDPNQPYVDAMSETERTAYYAALYGEQTYVEGEEEVEYDWTTAGCQGKASHEVYETGTGLDEEQFTALQDEMTAMYESASTDPRLAELDSAWSTCMADAGYPGFAAVMDAEQSIYEEVNAIWETAYADVDPNVEMTEEDYAAIDAQTQDKLAEITPREIETAVADYTCRNEVDYTTTQQEVNAEYQQEFMDAHQAELDAWLEAYQKSQG